MYYSKLERGQSHRLTHHEKSGRIHRSILLDAGDLGDERKEQDVVLPEDGRSVTMKASQHMIEDEVVDVSKLESQKAKARGRWAPSEAVRHGVGANGNQWARKVGPVVYSSKGGC